MFTMRTCLHIAKKIFANRNHLVDAFNNLNIMNMISKLENTRNRSHSTYYCQLFVPILSATSGKPMVCELDMKHWNTRQGCPEIFFDLAFG